MKNINYTSVPTRYEVLERTPGGFISKLKITEVSKNDGRKFSHIYYLEHIKIAKDRNALIDKFLKKKS